MSNDDNDVKLSFLAGQARIRLVISKAACDAAPVPPQDLIHRAIVRMEKGVKDGSMAFYNLYDDRLKLVWTKLRSAKAKPETKIAITLAAGTPTLPGVAIVAGPEPFLASLTIDATPEIISSWKFEFLKLTVIKQMRDLGIIGRPDSAVIQAIFLRALRGKKIYKMPLNIAPALPTNSADHFSVTARGVNGDLILVINNISSVSSEAARISILNWLEKFAENATKNGNKRFLLLKDDVEGRLKSFLRGPERLSIDLPATILAALAEPKNQDVPTELPGAVPATASRPPAPALLPARRPSTILLNFEGNQFFKMEVEPDKMAAKLSIISDKVYNDPVAITDERIIAFAQSKHVTFGIKPTVYQEIKSAIAEKKDIKTFEFAVGTPPVSPEEPYLHPTYKDPKKFVDETDMRDRQQSTFVRRGDVIAEVSFKKPGKPGCDVYGNPVNFALPELPAITCGANAEPRDKRYFVAQKDGLPQLTENSVAVEAAYVHNGNVNLTSGNINFDGPVIISGNITFGAVVCATGDLEVKGLIEESIVKCGGNLTAAGIISGSKGYIKIGGNATVAFINNSQMDVKGNLTLSGNITNSKIMVGKSVATIDDNSLILGGTIEFGETMTCANLGKGSGQLTAVSGGQDPFLAKRISTLSKRKEHLEKIKEEIKKSSRHLGGMKTGSTTKKHTNKGENLKVAQQHVSALITKVDNQIDTLKAKLQQFGDARINVKGTLSQNCKVSLNGKNISWQGDVIEVAVMNKRVKGSFLTPLDPAASEEKTA